MSIVKGIHAGIEETEERTTVCLRLKVYRRLHRGPSDRDLRVK